MMNTTSHNHQLLHRHKSVYLFYHQTPQTLKVDYLKQMVNEIHDQQASSFVLGHHCTSLGLVAMLRAIRQQRLKNHPENSQIMYKVLNPLHVKTDALNSFQSLRSEEHTSELQSRGHL